MVLLELDHPEVAALVKELRAEHRAPWLDVLERAIGRGELPADTEPPLVVDTILGVVMSRRLFFKNDPENEAYFASVVNLVLKGAEHGGASRPQRPTRTLRTARAARKSSA
jgi:hypothetical protein